MVSKRWIAMRVHALLLGQDLFCIRELRRRSVACAREIQGSRQDCNCSNAHVGYVHDMIESYAL